MSSELMPANLVREIKSLKARVAELERVAARGGKRYSPQVLPGPPAVLPAPPTLKETP